MSTNRSTPAGIAFAPPAAGGGLYPPGSNVATLSRVPIQAPISETARHELATSEFGARALERLDADAATRAAIAKKLGEISVLLARSDVLTAALSAAVTPASTATSGAVSPGVRSLLDRHDSRALLARLDAEDAETDAVATGVATLSTAPTPAPAPLSAGVRSLLNRHDTRALLGRLDAGR